MINALLYNNTIFHALDQPRLEREKKENQDISLMGRIQLGIQQGALGVLQNIVIGNVISFFAEQTLDSKIQRFEPLTFLEDAIIGSVMEEILFRGIFQNGIFVIQKAVAWIAPTSFKSYRVFIWITSPTCRILIINGLFAVVHLRNIPWYGVSGAVSMAVRIFLLPRCSILHETTGNIVAPIFAHITVNSIVICILKFFPD